MNKKIVLLMLTAFFVGDAQAVYRSNRKTRATMKKLKAENKALKMIMGAMTTAVDDVQAGMSEEDALKRCAERIEFINITQPLM